MQRLVCSCLAVLWLLPACKRPEAEVDGIGTFKLGVTTVAEAGVCSKRDNYTFCSMNGGVYIGRQQGDVSLYFADDKPESTATEILVTVSRCKPEPIEAELRKELGAARAQVGSHLAWVGKKAIIVAKLPAEPGVCEVSFLHPSETERIAAMSPPGITLAPK